MTVSTRPSFRVTQIKGKNYGFVFTDYHTPTNALLYIVLV